MPAGRNSSIYRVGEYVFKEVRRREFSEDPLRYARKYRFLERLAVRYPVNLPLRADHGERFVLANDRIYELHQYLARTSPWRAEAGLHGRAGSELARFHQAARATVGAHLVADNDVYAGTLATFDVELAHYRRACASRRDRISRYLRDYVDDLAAGLRNLQRMRRRMPRLTRGVIHRDLHPSNLLVQGTTIILMDYDSVTRHEQVLDLVFMMDRMVMDAAHPSRPVSARELRRAGEIIAAYMSSRDALTEADFQYALVILGEEYLKRTSSILRKHYLTGAPQDLLNLQRQDLRRLKCYGELLSTYAGGARVVGLIESGR